MPLLGLGRRHFNNPPAKAFLRIAGPMVPFRYLAGITEREVFQVTLAGVPFRYEFSGNDSIGEQLFWHGSRFFEPEAVAVFRPYLLKARTVLDVGANTGLYSPDGACVESRVSGGRMGAILRGTTQSWLSNIALNQFEGRAELRQEAAGDCNTTSFLDPHGELDHAYCLGDRLRVIDRRKIHHRRFRDCRGSSR